MSSYHQTVLLRETVDALQVKAGGAYVDCTAGGGDHCAEILRRAGANARLIAIDRDPDAVDYLTARFANDARVTVAHDEYKNIRSILDACGVARADGVIVDLGISGRHVDDPARGFSYHFDAPLDMRMSKTGVSARDLVNTLDERELADVIFTYGEERYARAIARNIVAARKTKPVETTGELVDIIKRSMPASAMRASHPAKRTFQALRIAVNGELDGLGDSVEAMFDCLAPGGRLAIITFHSLEDKEVKHRFTEFCRGCTCPPEFPVCVCGRKPRARIVFRSVVPTADEIRENNRARSARLRAVEKCE